MNDLLVKTAEFFFHTRGNPFEYVFDRIRWDFCFWRISSAKVP